MEKKSTISQFPPVVAVLGHVDHGKTSLLDAIRKSGVAEKEFGSITQKIGASSVEIEHEGKKRKITFIDTPGHEAFAKMRGRGAQAADVGILVVSSVDGVMPQTKESISLLKASGMPFIVALTMSDREGKNPEKVKGQLGSEGIALEGLGGDTPVIEVSAKDGVNIKELLELILLVQELHAEENKSSDKFSGIVIESTHDMRVGPKATVVVKNGKISLRDEIETESTKGRARTLINDRGKMLQVAEKGDAVELLGFEKVPSVGEIVYKKGEMDSNEEQKDETKKSLYDEDLLTLVIVADTQGSLEAILSALPQNINIVLQKTGEVTTADVLFGKSVGALVLGFNVRIKPEVAKLAITEKVLVKNYSLIYEMLDEIKDAVEGKELSLQEEVYGAAKILASLPFEKTKVMGVSVIEGRIAKGDRIRLIRGEEELGEANITSVRKGKEITSKVEKGEEAGIIVSPFLDFGVGDVIISHS
ncbi:MAG: GTP-binding protein [Candidatus Levybacteria bacterium]|nr:GTP-binding protein [Candidatus Levybacteria bacterium]